MTTTFPKFKKKKEFKYIFKISLEVGWLDAVGPSCFIIVPNDGVKDNG